MSKSYEELMGALGRAIFFRPERRRVRDLLSRDAQPQLLVDGEEYQLFDLSMNGISLISRNGNQPWKVGTETQLTLLLYNKEVYKGRARVARVEPGPKQGSRVGFGLTGGFLDLPEILRQDEEGRLENQLKFGPEYWRTRIPKALQEATSRAVHFLHFYRQTLDRHEARYKAPGGGGTEAIASLQERAFEVLMEPWTKIQRAASLAAVECLNDREVLVAAKEYTENLVTPVVMDCPILHRAYTKPLGYSGDYQVMLYIYNNAFEGDSVFARVFHKIAVEHPLSVGIRTRKDFVVRMMEKEHECFLAAADANPVFRVASLGCGPAREASDFIKCRKSWPGQVVFTLVDQEEEALSHAFHQSQSQIQATGANAAIQCLNLSFIQVLRDPSLVPIEHPQHFIFAMGLFDYLRELTGKVLIRALYEHLATGGLLAIGNAVSPNDHFWPPEFMMDWTMFYRTREEMVRLAELLPETAEVDVVLEPGGAYHFLMARKR